MSPRLELVPRFFRPPEPSSSTWSTPSSSVETILCVPAAEFLRHLVPDRGLTGREGDHLTS